MGGVDLAHGDERAALVEALNRNLYAFSAAKSLYQFKRFRELMVDADGNIRQHAAFKKAIADEGNVFNRAHLRAEYNLAQNSAIMADKWDRLNTEFLEYSTVGDARVRPEHKALDKFTAAKDDQVWNKIYPPKAFGCRCTVVPGKSQDVEKSMTSVEAARMMKPYIKDTIFDNHVGKSRAVFTDEHPYFIDLKGRKVELNWRQYGLRPWSKIETDQLPAFKAVSKKDYFEWWKKQSKASGDDIIVRDKTGVEIMLSSGKGKKGKPGDYFKDHVIAKPAEQRHQYAGESIRILKQPDEIWQTPSGRTYIRFYEQGPIAIFIDKNQEAKTVHLLDKEGRFESARSGVLVYRK